MSGATNILLALLLVAIGCADKDNPAKVFTDGIELKEFAAFELLKDAEVCDRIYTYFARHAAIATQNRTGFILDSVTWRASST
jgi:hypothetical protein